jgi:hypothetical protein
VAKGFNPYQNKTTGTITEFTGDFCQLVINKASAGGKSVYVYLIENNNINNWLNNS